MSEAWNKLPPNPERDAFHILADGDIQYVVRWNPLRGWMDEYLPIWAYECSYVGQLYTEAEIEDLRDALTRVMQWAEAYPEDIFPPVDLDAVRERLGDDALFSRLHAEWGRRLCKGIGGIARAALGESAP